MIIYRATCCQIFQPQMTRMTRILYSNTETQRHREKFSYKTNKIKTPCLCILNLKIRVIRVICGRKINTQLNLNL